MSEIQKLRERLMQDAQFVESGAVVLSKNVIAFWHMVSSVVGAVVGLFIHKYFNS